MSRETPGGPARFIPTRPQLLGLVVVLAALVALALARACGRPF